MAPLVSIVIPTFNRLQFVGEAVESCLRQSYPNIEIIVVDDGSTDGTDAYFRQRLSADWGGHVSYYRQENAGASAARNQGLRSAHGKYIQFLDSDDLLLPDKIALQVAQLEAESSAHEVCSCFGRCGAVPARDSESRRIGIHCATPCDYIRAMCVGVIHGMPTCAPLWSRSLLLERPGWSADISLGDDLEYYIRLLTHVRAVDFVTRELFLVREHEGSRLSDSGSDRTRVLSAITAHRRIADTVRRAGLWDAAIEAGLVRKARTLYVNILSCGTATDIRDFELWVQGTKSAVRCGIAMRLAIISRGLVGRRLSLALIRCVLWVKARLAKIL